MWYLNFGGDYVIFEFSVFDWIIRVKICLDVLIIISYLRLVFVVIKVKYIKCFYLWMVI